MKMVKSLLLGSAAGLVAIASAQAADLPVKAKPVQYVKICSLYGSGFYYMPGTDICVKIGGYARTELGYSSDSITSLTSGPLVASIGTRADNNFNFRSRGYITADARQQTEYGTVRGYLSVGLNYDLTNTAAAGLGPTATASNVSAATSGFSSNRNFIQFAGFTMGTAVSFFDFFSASAVAYNAGFLSSSDSGDGGVKVFAYTAQLGNGFSATISAEEPQRTVLFGAGAGVAVIPALTAGATLPGGLANGYGGYKTPDIVANIRIDQAWGSAQIMGALHRLEPLYFGATAATPGPNADKFGYVIGGGLKLNAPMFGQGDYFQGQIQYSEGASRYAFRTTGGPQFFNVGNSAPGAGNLGFGVLTDGVYAGGAAGPGNIELTRVTNFTLSYEHFWSPAWQTSVYGSYAQIRYSGAANAALCAAEGATLGAGFGVGGVATAGCNNNFSVTNVGTRTQWNINKNFYLGLDVIYSRLNSADSGNGVATPAATGTLPAGVFAVNDQNAYTFRFRAHRDFGF